VLRQAIELMQTTCSVFEVRIYFGIVYFNNINYGILVAAQGFTVLAMVGGSIYYQHKKEQEQKQQQE
jgi:hypothetical protein